MNRRHWITEVGSRLMLSALPLATAAAEGGAGIPKPRNAVIIELGGSN